jgi:hypothetical protein
MDTSNIIENLLNGNIVDAKLETESILYSKLNNNIEEIVDGVTDHVYGLSEKKKCKDDYDVDLDPVGEEDDDIDNDGDEDESDDYLHHRRRVRKKKISNREVNEAKEDDAWFVEGAEGDSRIEFIYGMKVTRYQKLTDKQKAQVKQRWYNERAAEEKKRGMKS